MTYNTNAESSCEQESRWHGLSEVHRGEGDFLTKIDWKKEFWDSFDVADDMILQKEIRFAGF